MASKTSVLKPVVNRYDYKIYHVDETGKPDKMYHPDDAMATCNIVTANIAVAMMKTEAYMSGLEVIATGLLQLRPNAWFLQGWPTEERATRSVHNYVGMYDTQKPGILIDDSMRNPNFEGFYTREPCDDESEFLLSDQHIVLNGTIAQRLLAAAILAHSSQDKNDLTNQDYRCFQFRVANTILHETAHIFVTYLNKGQWNTPRLQSVSMITSGASGSRNDGESGRMLEELMFGGTLNFYGDYLIGSPEYSCGMPCIDTATSTYRITQAAVDRTVNLDFKFPYEHSDMAEDPKKLHRVWIDILDPGYDPLRHPDWPKLRDAPLPYGG